MQKASAKSEVCSCVVERSSISIIPCWPNAFQDKKLSQLKRMIADKESKLHEVGEFLLKFLHTGEVSYGPFALGP